MKRFCNYCGTLCVLLALLTAGSSLYMQSKAMVAQRLLTRAWEKTLASGELQKAWPWADTWPVAKIRIPSQNKTMIVLEGASGEAMAFGPARLAGSSPDVSQGVTLLGGHRDTHLAFLQHMRAGDLFELQGTSGEFVSYAWTTHIIADARTHKLSVSPEQSGLVMITCYPFNAIQTGGPMRFIVVAEPTESQSLNQASNFSSKG